MRSAAAVAAGVATWLALVAGLDALAAVAFPNGFSPDGAHVRSAPLLGVMLIYWLASAGAGAFVAARMSGVYGAHHGVAVGVALFFFFALNLASAVTSGLGEAPDAAQDPLWWHGLTAVLVLPVTWAAGRAARRPG